MGNGIAHVFAMSGFQVNLIDISQDALDRALVTISNNLDRMLSKGKISEQEKSETLANLTTYTNLSEGVKNADLAVEAATENLELKLKIFKQIDENTSDDTILATTIIAHSSSLPSMFASWMSWVISHTCLHLLHVLPPPPSPL